MARTGVGRLVVIVLSVIPLITCIVAAYQGGRFALLAVTLGSVLACCGRAGCMLLTSRYVIKQYDLREYDGAFQSRII